METAAQQQTQTTTTNAAAAAGTTATAYYAAAAGGKPGVPQAYPSSSLYVGDLRLDVGETQLFDIFKGIGPISSIRVCRDATRRSLGYAYVNFLNPQDAARALETLNFTQIGGKPCRIMWSCRDPSKRKFGEGNIFVKFLDKSIDNQVLHDTFASFGKILSSKVETDERGVSKGYGYVHFETAEAANLAIEKVNGKEIAGKIVYVGWFVPRKQRNADEVKEQKFTNVYIRNLDPAVTQEALKEEFEKYGEITSCVVMCSAEGKSRGFGFVNFSDHEAAVKAVNEMNEKEMLSKKLLVARAQSKHEREASLKRQFEVAPRGNHAAAAAAAPSTANLYIKNLDDAVDDEALRKLFEHCGQITSCKVMLEDKTNTSRGFGFVCFANTEDAAKAVTEMNGAMIHGKPIYVALAQKKEQRRAQLAEQYSRNSMMKSFPGAGMAPSVYPQMFYPNFPAGMMYSPQMMMRQQVPWVGGRAGAVPMYPPQAGRGGAGRSAPAAVAGAQPGGQPPAYAQGTQPHQGYPPYGYPQQQFGYPYQQHKAGAQGDPAWSSRVKFSQSARNQPAYPGQQQQPRQMRAPRQPPQQAMEAQQQAAAPVAVAPQQQPTISQDFTALPVEEQRQIVGERLYGFVQREVEEPLWGKITGMLLESLGVHEVLALLGSPVALSQKIREAHEVYVNHMKQMQQQ